MEAYQQRVVVERDELSARVVSLRKFLQGPQTLSLPDAEHERMWLQLGLMTGLERVLNERIAAFPSALHRTALLGAATA